MKKAGKSDREIYLTAKSDGLQFREQLEMLESVYGLTGGEEKKVMLNMDSDTQSMSEYQEKYILPALKEAFEIETQESNKGKGNNKSNGR